MPQMDHHDRLDPYRRQYHPLSNGDTEQVGIFCQLAPINKHLSVKTFPKAALNLG